MINEILNSLGIDKKDVLNIYKYGSVVYGNNTTDSDKDFIIVFKKSLLSDGSFKTNAKSSPDKKIQAVFYSRSGFIDAINNYEIGALECMYLKEEDVILKNFDFKINRFYLSEFIKNIIIKSSDSEFIAKKQISSGAFEKGAKGIYHSIRILMFAIQIKYFNKIIDFSVSNDLKFEILSNIDIENMTIKNLKEYSKLKSELIKILKNE